MDTSQTGRRRPRPTLVLFDPLSAPSPTKPTPPTGFGTLAEHDDDDFDDNESFFSALGGVEGFPIEGGSLVGELVATSSPERPAPRKAATGGHDRPAADLMSWDSPVKPSNSFQLSTAAGSYEVGRVAVAKVPLPASPPASSPTSFDFLAPTPRPTSKVIALSSSSTSLAQARRVPLPESPPRRQNVMDWLAETPMPTRRVAAPSSAVDRRGPDVNDTLSLAPLHSSAADNTAATLASFEMDESYEDLLQTPAPRKPRAFVASANVTAFPSPTTSESPSALGPLPVLSHQSRSKLSPLERTTLLPSAPRWEDDEAKDDLMATPAPQRLNLFSAADLSVFPLPPSSSPLSSSVAHDSLESRAEVQDKTTVLPSIPADLDESFDNLMATPAPRRVQKLGPDASVFPSPLASADLNVSTSSSASSTSTASTAATATERADRDEPDQTGFWPALVGADETFDDLWTTPAPRRVKTLSVSPPSAPALTSPQPTTKPPQDASSLEAGFGYLLASTRGAPRTPVAIGRAPVAVDPSTTDEDESFDLGALKGVGMSDETFDLLSTPLPSLAQSRTSNFPRSPSTSPTPPAASTAPIEDNGDETLILSSKAFDFQDESFSLLSGARPTGLGDDDEADDWGQEEEKGLQAIMAAGSRPPVRPLPAANLVRTVAPNSIPSVNGLATNPAATPRRALRKPAQAAASSVTSSALRRTSSASARLAPRSSMAGNVTTPSGPASSAHRRTPSLASKDFSANRADEQTPSALQRTSSTGSATPRRASQAPAPLSTAHRRLSGIPAPPPLQPSTAGRDAHATSAATRPARPSVVRPPAPPLAVSATPSRAQHRRTSSVPVIATPLPRSASAARLNAAFANARTPVAVGRTPLVGLDPSVNAAPPEPASDPKPSASPAKTISRKDGTRSLSSSLSRPDGAPLSSSNSSLSALSQRVSSSRLHSRSLYALPGNALSAAPSVGTAASKVPCQSSLASGLRAPTASVGSKSAAGPPPTLESVRAALASLEARRRK